MNLTTGAVSSNAAVIDAGHIDGHVVRAGVNHPFNRAAPAPILAKF